MGLLLNRWERDASIFVGIVNTSTDDFVKVLLTSSLRPLETPLYLWIYSFPNLGKILLLIQIHHSLFHDHLEVSRTIYLNKLCGIQIIVH